MGTINEVFLFLRVVEGFPKNFQIMSTNEPSCALRTSKPKIPDCFVGPFLSLVGDSFEDAEEKLIRSFKEGKLDDYESVFKLENGFQLVYRVGNLRVRHKLKIK